MAGAQGSRHGSRSAPSGQKSSSRLSPSEGCAPLRPGGRCSRCADPEGLPNAAASTSGGGGTTEPGARATAGRAGKQTHRRPSRQADHRHPAGRRRLRALPAVGPNACADGGINRGTPHRSRDELRPPRMPFHHERPVGVVILGRDHGLPVALLPPDPTTEYRGSRHPNVGVTPAAQPGLGPGRWPPRQCPQRSPPTQLEPRAAQQCGGCHAVRPANRPEPAGTAPNETTLLAWYCAATSAVQD